MNKALKKIIDTSEYFTRNIIEKTINHNNYYLISQTPMNKVIDSNKLDLTKNQRKHYNDTTFDFVIVDKEGFAALIIEFDGPIHFKDSAQMKADLTKAQICSLAGLPLLRIDDTYINQKNRMSILEYILLRFNNWEIEKHRLKKDFEDYINNLSEEERQKSINNMDYLDYSPDIVFNYKYQFSEMTGIIDKIEKEIGLQEENNCVIENNQKSYYGFLSSNPDYSIDTKIKFVVRYRLYAVAVKETDKVLLNEEIIEEVTMSWYISDEKQINNKLFTSNSFMYDIPGTSIPELCENIAHYKCLKRILEKCKVYTDGGWKFI